MRRRHALDIFRAIGFEIGLDLEGELVVNNPTRSLPQIRAILNQLVRDCGEDLASDLRARSQMSMKQFVGGPFNGQRHMFCWATRPYVGMKVKRAEWASYRLMADGRAFFCGMATSETKARYLARHKSSHIKFGA